MAQHVVSALILAYFRGIFGVQVVTMLAIYEDETVLFFNDINPLAKIHVLGVPKTNCVRHLVM